MKQKNYFSIVRATLLALLVTFGFQRLNAQVSYDANVETYDFVSICGSGNEITADGNTLQKIGNTEIKSQYTGEYRFNLSNISSWTSHWDNIGLVSAKNDRTFTILGLHSGDIIQFKYNRSTTDDPLPSLQSDNVALVVNGVPETETYYEEVVNDDGSVTQVANERIKKLAVSSAIHSENEYYCVENGDISIQVTNYCRIREVIIKSWNNAEYEIVPSTYNGANGNTFRFTGAGVHTDKHAAVPFMTMQFGADNDKTIVSEYNGHLSSVTINHNRNDNHVTFKGENLGMEPVQGTYYYFYPEANGTLIIKGNNEWSNRHTMCIVEKNMDGTNVTGGIVIGHDGLNNGDEITFTVNVTKGRKYYISPNPLELSQTSSGANNRAGEFAVFHLYEYSFYPEGVYDGPLGMVAPNGSTSCTFDVTGNHNLHRVSLYSDSYHVGYLGNIKSADLSVEGDKLKITNVKYKEGSKINKGGAILVRANPYTDQGVNKQEAIIVVTIAYTAENYDGTGNQVKVWDFYSNLLAVGQYKNSSSQLKYETDKLPTDWVHTYLNLYKNEEEVFKSVYDMEGDNAHMIAETEGLIINSKTNEITIFNENDVNSESFQDRFVGLLPGAKLTIPRLKAGDYVRILMGRYGGPTDTDPSAYLTIENGYDLSLTPQRITDDYKIGGSSNRLSGGKCVLYGEYNFIVGDEAGIASGRDLDFSITMKDGKEVKLYRIEIYKSSEFQSNNGVLKRSEGENPAYDYEVVYTDGDAPKTMAYNLHNHGKGERTKIMKVDNVRGNLGDDFTDITSANAKIKMMEDEIIATYTPAVGKFGSYRLWLGNYTLDGKYVTDRARRSMAVGYVKKMPYPYTWDFTDLTTVTELDENGNNISGRETYIPNAIGFEEDANTDYLPTDYKGWVKSGDAHNLRNAPQNETGILFASGGQLYGANKMFAETAGIGFKRSSLDGDTPDDIKELNRSIGITNASLVLNSTKDGRYHKMVIPKVPANSAVYVRALPLDGAKLVKLCSKDGTTGNNFDAEVSIDMGDGVSDKIYVMKNDTERDIELWLNGMAVYKIGVSIDAKTVNDIGYTTESRDHAIDHSLTNYFTGGNFKTYIVTGADEDNLTTEVLEVYDEDLVTQDNTFAPVLPANTGCFIYNNAGESFNVASGKVDGFHLFVPDMHDTKNTMVATTLNQNMLKPLNGSITRETTDEVTGKTYYNYVMTYQWVSVDPETGAYNPNGPTSGDTKVEGFYRIAQGATARGTNKAYLPIEKSTVSHAPVAFFLNLVPTAVDPEEPLSEDYGNQDVDAISLQNAADVDAVWYNMNGQKLNGKPAKSGVYIMNGRKVVIK